MEERPPVWLMRQAGRYMPEYRAIRAKYSFLEMCRQPELAATITQQPLKAFGMDAAILFSDILVIADALGITVHFEDGVGPIIEKALNTEKDVTLLQKRTIKETLGYVAQAISLLKPLLQVPLIGFCGAPFTVASYFIEGKSSRDLKKTKRWMLSQPDSFHQLLEKITECTIDYLEMQIAAGIDAIQIFDSWASVLAHAQFEEFSLEYLRKILNRIQHRNIPVILFAKGSSVFAKPLTHLNPAAISLDWNCDITQMRKIVPSHIALQGNLDPDILLAPNNIIRKEVQRILKGMKKDPGYVFNLGHGISPDVPTDAVKTLVDCVKEAAG